MPTSVSENSKFELKKILQQSIEAMMPSIRQMIVNHLYKEDLNRQDSIQQEQAQELNQLDKESDKLRAVVEKEMNKLGGELKIYLRSRGRMSFFKSLITNNTQLAVSLLNTQLSLLRDNLTKDLSSLIDATRLNKYFIICSILCLHSSRSIANIAFVEDGLSHRLLIEKAYEPDIITQLLPELRLVISREVSASIPAVVVGGSRSRLILPQGPSQLFPYEEEYEVGSAEWVAAAWGALDAEMGYYDQDMTLDSKRLFNS